MTELYKFCARPEAINDSIDCVGLANKTQLSEGNEAVMALYIYNVTHANNIIPCRKNKERNLSKVIACAETSYRACIIGQAKRADWAKRRE